MDDADEKPSYSPLFPLCPDTDLVVQSSDGTLFATQALYLRAVSTVLRATLAKPVPDAQGAHDGHRLLKLEEGTNVVRIFLRYCHPGKLIIDGKPPTPVWATVILVASMFDKYEMLNARHSFLMEQLPRFFGNPRAPQRNGVAGDRPLDVFAYATIYGHEEIAQRALECLAHWGRKSPDVFALSHRNPDDPQELEIGWRSVGLGDLPLKVLSRMSPKHIHRFCVLHDKVASTKGCTWYKVAKDFKVCLSSPFVLSLQC